MFSLVQVKTNSTNPYKNEKNVTLNLNIPASVSGFLLEEIDLKYVKKSRKKSKNDKLSNLLIKYFTNRSSNLHLSSVTKEEDNKPEYYQYEGELKERRDQVYNPLGKNNNALEQQSFERPFRYRHKYPLRLLEKIRSSTKRMKKQREGRVIDASGNGENDARLRRSSAEEEDLDLSEDDLKALESILVKKTSQDSTTEISADDATESETNPSISDIYDIFEHAIENTADSTDRSDKNDISNKQSENFRDTEFLEVPEKKTPLQSTRNWFTSTLPQYILSVVPQPVKSVMFSGNNYLSRKKRSAEADADDVQSRQRPYKKFKYSYSKNPRMKKHKRVMSPFFPTKFLANRPLRKKNTRAMVGSVKLIPHNTKGRRRSSRMLLRNCILLIFLKSAISI